MREAAENFPRMLAVGIAEANRQAEAAGRDLGKAIARVFAP
jgi:hypothetical protein